MVCDTPESRRQDICRSVFSIGLVVFEESGRFELRTLPRCPGGSDPVWYHYRHSPIITRGPTRNRTSLSAFGVPIDPRSPPRGQPHSFPCLGHFGSLELARPSKGSTSVARTLPKKSAGHCGGQGSRTLHELLARHLSAPAGPPGVGLLEADSRAALMCGLRLSDRIRTCVTGFQGRELTTSLRPVVSFPRYGSNVRSRIQKPTSFHLDDEGSVRVTGGNRTLTCSFTASHAETTTPRPQFPRFDSNERSRLQRPLSCQLDDKGSKL